MLGPSMNILIKLTCLIGLVMAPLLAVDTPQVDVQLERSDEGLAKGTVTFVTNENGQLLEKVQVFQGSEEEVNEAITSAKDAAGVK